MLRIVAVAGLQACAPVGGEVAFDPPLELPQVASIFCGAEQFAGVGLFCPVHVQLKVLLEGPLTELGWLFARQRFVVGAATVATPFAEPQALVTTCPKLTVTVQAVTTEPVA
jgi:hypothetical protein